MVVVGTTILKIRFGLPGYIYVYIPCASTTIKITVDPISMIKTPIVLMVVGIPGYIYPKNPLSTLDNSKGKFRK